MLSQRYLLNAEKSNPFTSAVYASRPTQYMVAAAGTTTASGASTFLRACSSIHSTWSPVRPASNKSTTATSNPSTGTPCFPRRNLATSPDATVTARDKPFAATLRRAHVASAPCHSHATTFSAPARAAIIASRPEPAPISRTLTPPRPAPLLCFFFAALRTRRRMASSYARARASSRSTSKWYCGKEASRLCRCAYSASSTENCICTVLCAHVSGTTSPSRTQISPSRYCAAACKLEGK